MAEHADNPHHERRWLILAIIGVAQLMVILDATIVNIALPSAQADLGFSDDSRQWVITAYALAFGSLLLLGGKLGDLFGRKWAFIGGLIGFAVASAAGGAATSFGLLAAARAAQGVFGAVLAPSALALLATSFTDPGERAKAFAIFGGIAGAGASIGLLLGGILTETLNWRWCLYVNLLLAVPAAIAGFRLLHTEAQPQRPRIDLPGTLTVTAGLFALVYAFSNSETHSWGHPVTIAGLAIAVVLLTAFALIQRSVSDPLLPLRIFDRTRTGVYAAMGLSGAAMFAVFLFLTYFMQQNLGLTPIQTGLGFLPMSLTIVVVAGIVNVRLLSRVGPRVLMFFGTVMGALALAWFAQLEPGSSYAGHVLPGLDRHGARHGEHLRPRLPDRHCQRPALRLRRRLGDAQHHPAGRRLTRHRPAVLDLRQRRRRLRDEPRSRPGPAGRGHRARLHGGVLGRLRPVRPRRDRRGAPDRAPRGHRGRAAARRARARAGLPPRRRSGGVARSCCRRDP